MTHEELLQKLADIAHNKDAHEARNDYLLALRAVVELHRPMEYGSCYGCDDRCGCYEGDLGDYNKWDTCPTIQSIQKELM